MTLLPFSFDTLNPPFSLIHPPTFAEAHQRLRMNLRHHRLGRLENLKMNGLKSPKIRHWANVCFWAKADITDLLKTLKIEHLSISDMPAKKTEMFSQNPVF